MIKHGMDGTAEYRAWINIKSRCLVPTDANYYRYGARGITIAPEWRDDFAAFYEHVGARPGPGYSIDRIDNNGDYAPGNIRWATAREQASNRRSNRFLSFGGRTQTVAQWAREIGITRQGLRRRLDVQLMTVEDALTAPLYRGTP